MEKRKYLSTSAHAQRHTLSGLKFLDSKNGDLKTGILENFATKNKFVVISGPKCLFISLFFAFYLVDFSIY